MHREIIQDITLEQAKEYICDIVDYLKERDSKYYTVAEDMLYEDVYGDHFNKSLSMKAVSELENEGKRIAFICDSNRIIAVIGYREI